MPSDNTQLNVGLGGDVIRDIAKAGAKTQVVCLDLGGTGAESIPSAGYIPNRPILQQDLIGNVANGYPAKVRGFVFGRAPVVNNTRVDLWGGPTPTYVFPTVGMQMSVVSTSANDTALGTGVQKVSVHYLDSNYAPHIEEVTLNGLTPVNTVATNILRINALHATAVGSGMYSAGNISLTGGGVTYGFITAGNNTARQAIYTVPAGVTGYISHWQASSGSTGNHFCQITLTATCHDGTIHPGVFLVQDEQGSQNNGATISLPIVIPIPAMTDVKLTAISDAANANVIAIGSIMGWFE